MAPIRTKVGPTTPPSLRPGRAKPKRSLWSSWGEDIEKEDDAELFGFFASPPRRLAGARSTSVVVSSRPKRHPRPGDAIFEVSDAEEGHIRPAVRYPARKQILGFIKEGLKDGRGRSAIAEPSALDAAAPDDMQMGPEPKLQPKAETKPMITPGTTATSAASTNALAPRPTLFPGGRHAALLDKLARLAALSPVIANKILTAYDAAIAPLDEDVDALLKIGEKYM